MLVLAGVAVSSTFPLLRGSGATQTTGYDLKRGAMCEVEPIWMWGLLGKSMVVPYTLGPFEFSGVSKCNPLNIKPLAGDLSFA